MLEVRDLHAYYGQSHVLFGVNLQVFPGEIVAILGRNGVGRSTLARAIMGLVQVDGSIVYANQQLIGLPPYRIAALGIGYVPENRDVFPGLTVAENLLLGGKSGRGAHKWKIDDMYELFPRLAERRDTRAGVLSGGEQQMLTLCRTLMGNPDLILIDEPTEGLAPRIVEQVGAFLLQLKERGVTMILIEQKLAIALEVSERVLVMGHGRIVYEGSPKDLQANTTVREEWLAV